MHLQFFWDTAMGHVSTKHIYLSNEGLFKIACPNEQSSNNRWSPRITRRGTAENYSMEMIRVFFCAFVGHLNNHLVC